MCNACNKIPPRKKKGAQRHNAAAKRVGKKRESEPNEITYRHRNQSAVVKIEKSKCKQNKIKTFSNRKYGDYVKFSTEKLLSVILYKVSSLLPYFLHVLI